MFKQIDRILSSATVALLILCSSSAFAVQVGGSGPINPVSIPGSLEVNQLVVSTTIETVQGIKLGMGDSAGTMRWTGSNFEGFDGSTWKSLDVQSTSEGWTEDVPGNKVYVTDTARNVGIGTSETAAKLDVGGSVLARGNITAEGVLGSSGIDIDTGGDTSLTTANHTFDLGFLIEGLYVRAPVLNAESMSSMPEVVSFPHALGFYDKVAIIDKSDTGESELLFSKSTLADGSASLIADYSNQMFVLNWDLCAEPDEDDAPVYSIGKPSQKWKDAYFSGNVTVDGIKLSDGHLITSLAPASIQVAFDGGGTAIAEAAILDVVVPFNCTIESVTLLAQQTGSIVVDIWKDVYDNYPPTVDDTITASAKPTISSGVKSRDAVLTGWTTHLSADDIIRFKVDSCSGIENCLVILSVIRN